MDSYTTLLLVTFSFFEGCGVTHSSVRKGFGNRNKLLKHKFERFNYGTEPAPGGDHQVRKGHLDEPQNVLWQRVTFTH